MSQTASIIAAPIPERSLRAVLRHPPELAPGDSLHRFAQIIRFEPMGMLPVTANGELFGILAQTDLVPILQSGDTGVREIELQRPVADYMRPPIAVLRANMTLEEAGSVFAESGQTMLPVLDDRDYYLGAVSASDLLVPELPAPRPARIGGMATPFGVYLTDGTVQAGVGNYALVATGIMMAVLSALAYGAIVCLFNLLGLLVHRPIDVLLLTGDDSPIHNPWLGLASIGTSLLMFVIFMMFMRLTRLAGYHAAEHQTVHAIERCESLATSTVRRMPRPHPRCGTNLMAAVFVFYNVQRALGYMPFLGDMFAAQIMAAIVTLFVWRPVGTFMQERFTTKPADELELNSGIAAGNDLLARYLEEAPVRPSLARRIWCSGMLQVMIGSIPVGAFIFFVVANWHFIIHR
jgi:CBS domain-containing protein